MRLENLKEWALVAEIISAVAVVLSLIFVAIQIRDGTKQTILNTQAIQATALQQHFEQHSSLALAIITNPGLASVIFKGRAGLSVLSDEEVQIFAPFASNLIRNYFVGYELMRSDILPELQWRTFEASLGRALKRNTGYREFWESRRSDYPDEFRTLVDELVTRAEGEESGIN